MRLRTLTSRALLPRWLREPVVAVGGGGPWTWAALAVGRGAGWLSQRLGLGHGSVVAGRVALMLDPGVLRWLVRGRTVVLVSGTNGKTTTSHLLAGALRTVGEVAHNASGSNMADGAVAALARLPRARWAVLEVDELHLAEVADAVDPAALVLLNLTRDQLDRVTEVRVTAERIRQVLAAHPNTVAVANADDPLTVWAATPAARRVWVAAGGGWHMDAASCPRCGELLQRGEPLLQRGEPRLDHDTAPAARQVAPRHRLVGVDGHPSESAGVAPPGWVCPHCGLARPDPQWWWEYSGSTGEPLAHHAIRAGEAARCERARTVTVRLRVGLPGRVNLNNAVMALAGADTVGLDPARGAAGLASVEEVAGRYLVTRIGAHVVRLLLVKNPAGWVEALEFLHVPRPIVVVVNAHEADGRDVSWLWDLPVEQLATRPVAVAGDRAADLGVRLSYAGIDHVTDPDPLAALRGLPTGEVDVVANYTAFLSLRDQLARQAQHHPRRTPRRAGFRQASAAGADGEREGRTVVSDAARERPGGRAVSER